MWVTPAHPAPATIVGPDLFLVLVVLPSLLMVPTIIAALHHRRPIGWFALANVAVGWTVVGWIALLVMAIRQRGTTDGPNHEPE